MGDTFEIGETRFALPPGYGARLLSDPNSRREVTEFVVSSPDHSVYHLSPYFDFARAQGSACDLALIAVEGAPAFAIPLHTRTNSIVVTGYSGVVLPPTSKEASLKRSIEALGSFLELNASIRFEVLQSAQAPAYDDVARTTFLARYLDELPVTTDRIYSRLLKLEQTMTLDAMTSDNGRYPGSASLIPDTLDNAPLGLYSPAARNQVRQALRRGLIVDCFCATEPAGADEGHAILRPLHEATWARSGQGTHTLAYWLDLSSAIADVSGAADLVVVVSDPAGQTVAGVICHLYRARAIYWSGCSVDDAKASHANPLGLHAAISLCASAGVTTFELGRFRPREPEAKERAVTRYKSQFGGELVPVLNFRAHFASDNAWSSLRSLAGRTARAMHLR